MANAAAFGSVLTSRLPSRLLGHKRPANSNRCGIFTDGWIRTHSAAARLGAPRRQYCGMSLR